MSTDREHAGNVSTVPLVGSTSQYWQLAPRDVYQRYLATVLQLTGAAGASVLVASSLREKSEWILLHDGNIDPIPELVNLDSAATAIQQRSQADGDDRHAVIRYYPSRAGDGCMVSIAVGIQPLDVGNAYNWLAEGDRRDSATNREASARNDVLWIGLRYGLVALPTALKQLRNPGKGTPTETSDWLAHTLTLSGRMAWETCQLSALLRDPVSQLPGRAEFQSHLKHAFQAAANIGTSIGLVLLNPDDFDAVNRLLDRASGDRAVAEIAGKLRACLRSSDLVFRYGGAAFALLLPKASEETIDDFALKIRQGLTGAYLDGAVRLSFSIGTVVYRHDSEQSSALDDLGLLQRADQALNLAKRAGGGCSVRWTEGEADEQVARLDRLSGIFTADTEKDYRNMLLLWDTIKIVSASAQQEHMAAEFVALIDASLQPTQTRLIAGAAAEKPRILATSQRGETGAGPDQVLSTPQRDLLTKVEQVQRTEQLTFSNLDPDSGEQVMFLAFAVPLLAADRYLGCLYMEGPEHRFALDTSDLIFLNALANQLALALDRTFLAARWKAEKERESLRLREEVHELRKVVHSARLIYSSRQMQAVLDTLRAVASTDVTILVNGESGTGKEVLARAVHEQSERRDKPLVTVDCGAIAHSLMETELFGHVKGAFTGANTASEGRIVQADGGTLFLDEIGEIPLDVQAKLLRFVQEKEINPVGAKKSRQVDVRIVAATNRDLAGDVAAGKFREDLFYRLNVVTLTSPPLRDRPDDIVPLAHHFLEKFALQYGKGVHKFGPGAEQSLLDYKWPGNVRELQNCILRAVVLCAGDAIGIELLHSGREGGDAQQTIATASVAAVETATPVATADVEPAAQTAATPLGDPWQELQRGLGKQLELLLADRNASPRPLGRWLSEDLVLTADEQARGNSRRASGRLGVAETTYRRQLEKARTAQAQGLLTRTQNWSGLQVVIEHLSDTLGDEHNDNLIEHARQILLAEVTARADGNDKLGSALMGVTIPTYRRWLRES